jgi:hypothetical protein
MSGFSLSQRCSGGTHTITTGVVTRWAWKIDASDPEIAAISIDDDV